LGHDHRHGRHFLLFSIPDGYEAMRRALLADNAAFDERQGSKK
jgi:hypothetical protein